MLYVWGVSLPPAFFVDDLVLFIDASISPELSFKTSSYALKLTLVRLQADAYADD
jgi:hypothetical protein